MQRGYFKTAWSDVTQSPHWVTRILLLALLSFIPVFGWIVIAGYLWGWVRDMAWGLHAPLPERIFENLSKVLGFTMKQKVYADEVIPNSGIFDGMRNTDHHSVLMEVVKELVASVTRIANDLLLYDWHEDR